MADPDGPLYVAKFPGELHDYLATLGARSKKEAVIAVVAEARRRGWQLEPPAIAETTARSERT